jgi:hypothetical protein
MFDGIPLPPGTEIPPIGPVEAWFNLFLAFWLFFFMVLLILPRPWADAIIEIAFPFLPPKDSIRPDDN